MKIWKFLNKDRCLGYGDGRGVIVGAPLSVEGEIILCEHGIHGSIRPLDALQYAPGSHIAFGELSGAVVVGDDKVAGETFTPEYIFDATRSLQEFAVWCAERAIRDAQSRGITVDLRSIEAVRIIRLWLIGQASKEEVARATYAAARAARAAYAVHADDAAYAAARAAYAAARAAYAAARAAYADTDAAAAAAVIVAVTHDAHDDEQNAELKRLLNEQIAKL